MLNTKERICPVCDTNSFVPFAEERIDPSKINNFSYASRKQPEFMCLRLVQCNSCDVIYAPNPPQADFLLNAYSEADFDSSIEAKAAANSYAKALEPYVAQLSKRNAAVDVGAGSGPLLPWLCNKGFSPVLGIEPSRAAIQAADPQIRPMLREGLFSPDLIQDITPSFICSFMTLEHMGEPGEFVQSAYNLLEPGGMLALVVHNWRAPLNRLLGLRSPIIDIEHLQLFSPKALKVLMEKTGFQSVQLQSIKNAYPLRYWLRLTPLPNSIKNLILNMVTKLGFADRRISLKVGNILAVGIKPTEQAHE